MRLSLLIFIIAILNLNSFAQNNNDSISHRKSSIFDNCGSIYKLGYTYQKGSTFDFGYGYGKIYENSISPMIIAAPYIQLEFIPQHGMVYGHRIGFEFSAILISTKISFVRYTDFYRSTLAFTPEIGLTLLSMFTLNYGHNFNLINEQFHSVSLNRISFGINISNKRN